MTDLENRFISAAGGSTLALQNNMRKEGAASMYIALAAIIFVAVESFMIYPDLEKNSKRRADSQVST
ncbi:hypothetical protein LP417_05200 [Polaromonas sp. P1-6]|nr:hypothetical protein LP417_05200 [Polaromonas sp. P1-6]